MGLIHLNNEKSILAFQLTNKLLQSQTGNKKLGAIYSFSLPASTTCPGSTSYCLSRCYALKTMKRWPNTTKAWEWNLELSKREDFREILTKALSNLPPNLLRLHVAGDIYSVEYFWNWIYALKNNPHIYPFAFTRSWRDSNILAAIKKAGYPKWLMASIDPETIMRGEMPPKEMRIARMSEVLSKKGGHQITSIEELKRRIPLICTEQVSETTCLSCGRCGLVRLNKGEFVKLKSEKGVSFAEH